MKIFSFTKLPSFSSSHPQEDYFIVSKKHPIFVVADGVSLNFNAGQDYPKKSGAGEAAKIFCETVISEAEKRYENFKEENLKEIFKAGNKAVFEYNLSMDRAEKNINYWDVDLFSATTAFVLIKNSEAYWFSLCDSGLAVFKKKEKIFQSPGGWINFPQNWVENKGDKEKVIIRHRDYRNAVKNGKLIGYGVVTGEESVLNYLNFGTISGGDLFLLYTDGFENYLPLKDFTELFQEWPENLKKQFDAILDKREKEDSSKFGREKTLIVVSQKQ